MQYLCIYMHYNSQHKSDFFFLIHNEQFQKSSIFPIKRSCLWVLLDADAETRLWHSSLIRRCSQEALLGEWGSGMDQEGHETCG